MIYNIISSGYCWFLVWGYGFGVRACDFVGHMLNRGLPGVCLNMLPFEQWFSGFGFRVHACGSANAQNLKP